MLKPARTMILQDMMKTPEAGVVMGALNGAGEARALFVGGCVRNALLEQDVSDIDIATIRTPEQVTEKLEAAGVRVIPTGIDHGTVTAVLNHQSFEITTLRKDIETDGRRAVISYTDDWVEDAERRDFTMNTLLCDGEGNVYDPTGLGLADLEEGKVCFVGDPAGRIAEDYLRILRFFRFHVYYGQGAPDEKALVACRNAAGKIDTLSRERITQEFSKILMAPDPVPVLSLMFDHDVLKDLPAQGFSLSFITGDMSLEARLLVLARFKAEEVRRMEQWLIFSKAQKREINTLAQALEKTQEINESAVKILVYRHGNKSARQIVSLYNVKEGAQIETAVEKVLKNWEAPKFPLNGDDVQKAGIEQGEEIGRILREIEDWWIKQGFQPDREGCLARLQKT